MNLTESYLELYSICDTYNALVKEEREVEKQFTDLDSFLRLHQSEIEKYRLVPDINRMFRNNEFYISKIEQLIQQKRVEEEKRRRRNNVLIKWGIIILVLTILTLYKWWITVILGVVFGGILFQFPRLRNKTGAMISEDWRHLIGK